MVEVRDRDSDTYIVTPQSYDGGAGAAAMVIISLILIAIVGYMIYAFNMNPPQTVIDRTTNTTIQQPVPTPVAPTQQPANAPMDTNSALPPTSSDNTSMPSSNQ